MACFDAYGHPVKNFLKVSGDGAALEFPSMAGLQTAFKLPHGIKMDMNDFAAWLQNELDIRGWRQIDLVRKSGVNRGLLSQILNRRRKPGVSTCRAIAHAFNMREVDVLHRAGLIAAVPNEDLPLVQELIAEFIQLDSSDQEQILKHVRALNIMNTKAIA